MVGVAGKSKGCTTCRRRKIRCDLDRPTCQNCISSKRKCEGYGRYPVFINRTNAGMQKRIPLEEAKPASAISSKVRQSDDVTVTKPQSTALPAQLKSGAIEGAAFISWYWNSIAPSLCLKGSLQGRVSNWIYHIITLASPQPALDQSLIAISVTRCGLAHEDPILLTQGRQLYVRSLSLLQRTLYIPELAVLDETFATVCVLMLYEVWKFFFNLWLVTNLQLFGHTSRTLDGWQNHLNGIETLLEVRGPERLRAPLGRALFENCRYLLMMQSILQRKRSIFGRPEWRIEPWRDAEKCTEQRVLDYGLMLGTLLDRSDTALNNPSSSFADMVELLRDCTDLYGGLQNLLDRCLFGALQSHTKIVGTVADIPHSPSATAKYPEDLVDLVLSITALGLQLVVCATACKIIRRVERSLATPLKIESKSSLLVCDWTDYEWFRTRPPFVAQSILRSASRALHNGIDVPSASRLFFPLQLASEQFRSSQPQKGELTALLQRLEGKDLQFVPRLSKNDSIARSRGQEVLTCEHTIVL